MNTRVLTGITTSGTPHLGNYVGAIRPAIQASQQNNVDAFFFLADYHALIKSEDPALIAQRHQQEMMALQQRHEQEMAMTRQRLMMDAQQHQQGLYHKDQAHQQNLEHQRMQAMLKAQQMANQPSPTAKPSGSKGE